MRIKIEVSARHCHLSQNHLDRLFGKNFKLNSIKELSQKGEFASKQTVKLKVRGGQIDNLRIVGPVRDNTQIELSADDAHDLNIKAPLRLSGDIKGSSGCLLVGPRGKVSLDQGVIIAKRHIHCDNLTAKKLNLRNNQRLSVKTSGNKSVTFHNCIVRIKDTFRFRLHIDTDEANASCDDGVCGYGQIVK